jgi:hypothetical protein
VGVVRIEHPQGGSTGNEQTEIMLECILSNDRAHGGQPAQENVEIVPEYQTSRLYPGHPSFEVRFNPGSRMIPIHEYQIEWTEIPIVII